MGRIRISPDFLRFAVVGTQGFCWDTATVYTLRLFTNLYVAASAGFVVAATANWLLNRIWTFRHQEQSPAHHQWVRFMLANSVGFVLNRGVLFFLAAVSPLCHRMPVLPIIAGSFAGLAFNYFLSKRFVFR